MWYTHYVVVASALVALFLQDFAIPDHQKILPTVDARAARAGVLDVLVQKAGTVTSVARGSQRIPVMELTMRASCVADVQVHSLVLMHRGLGSQEDIDAVYAGLDGVRVSTAQTIASHDGRVQLRLRDVVVPACGANTLTVFMDLSPDAAISGEHRFVLAGGNPLETSAGSVAIAEQGESALLRATPFESGSVKVEVIRPLERIRFGEGRTVARLRLTATGNRAQRISSIRLENQGSAQGDDLRNLVLTTSAGAKLSRALPAMDGKSVLLTLSPPLLLERKQERLLSLKADVWVGASTTVRFAIEEPSDVSATPVRSAR